MKIQIDNIDFSFYNKKGLETSVLESFSLNVNAKSMIAIVGPSGCGKSTILKIIAGLLKPSQGTVFVGGAAAEQRRREGVFGLVFQSPDLLPWRTVARNVQLPLEICGRSLDDGSIQRSLEEVGLDSWGTQYPYQLSGGMQQRAALARALVSKPNVLLLDEPFSHLDELLRFDLLFHVQQHAKINKTTVILVTHDISEAVIAADEVIVLSDRPVCEAVKIAVPLSSPRSLASADEQLYHNLVSEVRLCLKDRSSKN